MTIEEQIAQLEQIVEEMQSKDISLEKSIECFKNGINIAKDCLRNLEGCKGQILEIKREMDALIATPIDNEF